MMYDWYQARSATHAGSVDATYLVSGVLASAPDESSMAGVSDPENATIVTVDIVPHAELQCWCIYHPSC